MSNDNNSSGGIIGGMVFGGFALAILAVLLAVSLVAALVWLVIAIAIAVVSYRRRRSEAEQMYRVVMREVGADYPVDDVIRAIYGPDIDLPDNGYNDPADWFFGSVFGVN